MSLMDLSLDIQQVAHTLLSTRLKGYPFDVKPIVGGGNNRSYLIATGQENYFLKHYYRDALDPRNRLAVDYLFSSYAWSEGIRSIAEPIASDHDSSVGIYAYLQGRKLTEIEVESEHVDSALDFVVKLNARRDSAFARELPIASEACFSLEAHVQLMQKRIEQLRYIECLDDIDRMAQQFIQAQLIPSWLEIKKLILEVSHHNEPIAASDRVLSPSDFGFHNALLDEDGQLVFFDFEYAGWDDPAKLVCDFFLQPTIPVSMAYFPTFSRKIATLTAHSVETLDRIETLFPLIKIKWCCIALNCFVPAFKNRKQFSSELTDEYRVKQIEKAARFLF